jgi:hypothetical protein
MTTTLKKKKKKKKKIKKKKKKAVNCAARTLLHAADVRSRGSGCSLASNGFEQTGQINFEERIVFMARVKTWCDRPPPS